MDKVKHKQIKLKSQKILRSGGLEVLFDRVDIIGNTTYIFLNDSICATYNNKNYKVISVVYKENDKILFEAENRKILVEREVKEIVNGKVIIDDEECTFGE